MLFPMIGDWFVSTMATLFVWLLDTMAYNLLATAYNVFDAVAEIDIFGASEAGAKLYNGITSRFYTILSIVMVFVFAYQLIMMIVDPDGKEKNASTKLVKDTLFSLIVIILLPTIFKYMSIFQRHVVKEGTIARIIMGTGGSYSDSPGKSIALMVFMSFYHPEGTSWTTFFGPVETKDASGKTVIIDGLLMPEGSVDDNLESSEAYQNCLADTLAAKNNETGESHTKTCKKFVKALAKWDSKDSTFSGIGYVTGDSDLRSYIAEDKDHTMEYVWILSTGAGLLVAWTFFAYSIDIGTRAIKLGLLEIIAPIPMVLRIFPQSRKTFETWLLEIRAAYLEIFLRLAIIFFGVEVIKMVPDFIAMIFASSSYDGLTKCIATVILILGLLKFCQLAPDLFKEIFSAGNNLFKGLNLNPKIRSHIEDNKAAMKGYNAVTSAAGGMAETAYKGLQRGWKTSEGLGDSAGSKVARGAIAGLSAIAAAPRGIISGGMKGLQSDNQKITKESASENMSQGLVSGAKSWNKMTNSNMRKNVNTAFQEAFNIGNADAKTPGQILKGVWSRQIDNVKGDIKEGVAKFKDKKQQLAELLDNPLAMTLSNETLGSLKKILDESINNDPRIAAEKAKIDKIKDRKTTSTKEELAQNEAEWDRRIKECEANILKYQKENANGAGKDNIRHAAAAVEKAIHNEGFTTSQINDLQTAMEKALGTSMPEGGWQEFVAQIRRGDVDFDDKQMNALLELNKQIKTMERQQNTGSTIISETGKIGGSSKKSDSSKDGKK